MQETSNETSVQPPSCYDWSEFTRKERGFLAEWCRDHKHSNGEEFSYKTVYALLKGDYTGGAGTKIAEIIRAALAEKLIAPLSDLDEAA
jgi:hypothetical protein